MAQPRNGIQSVSMAIVIACDSMLQYNIALWNLYCCAVCHFQGWGPKAVALFVCCPAGLNHLNKLRWAGVNQTQLIKACIIVPALCGQKFLGNRILWMVKSSSVSECLDLVWKVYTTQLTLNPRKKRKECGPLHKHLHLWVTAWLESHRCQESTKNPRRSRIDETIRVKNSDPCWRKPTKAPLHHDCTTSWTWTSESGLCMALLDLKPLNFHCWTGIEEPKNSKLVIDCMILVDVHNVYYEVNSYQWTSFSMYQNVMCLLFT